MYNFINKEILNWQSFYQLKAQQSRDPRLIAFYQAGTCHNETPLSEVNFVALDFETTGLDANKNSIISIGLVPFTLNRIYCRQAQHWYVSPEDRLEENSIIIHGITHSDLQDAPDFTHMLEPLLLALAGKVVVVHYRHIERNFFDSRLRALLQEGIIFPLVDTMQIEANVQNKQAGGVRNWLRGRRRGSVRLAQSRRRYNLPDYPPHDALTDAIATAELLQAQIKYYFSADTAIKKLWL